MHKLYKHHTNSQIVSKWWKDKDETVYFLYTFVHKPNIPKLGYKTFNYKISTYIMNCMPYCEDNYISFLSEKDMKLKI